MRTFKDIFKKSFIEGFSRYDNSPENIILVFGIALIFALYIFFAYRVLTKKTFYSKSFNIALPCLTLITAAVILTIQSSIVVSLGMVGALSIVRFRTAIKEPMDLVFLFWAITNGIICGAGFAEISCVLALVMTIVLVVLEACPVAKMPKILMVSTSGYENESLILETVRKYCKHFAVKSRSLSGGREELVVEVRTDKDSELARDIASLECVTSSSLLKHDGEVTY